jgi:hypothetical protein
MHCRSDANLQCDYIGYLTRRFAGIETLEQWEAKKRNAARTVVDELRLAEVVPMTLGLRWTHRRSMELAKNESMRIRFRVALKARGS